MRCRGYIGDIERAYDGDDADTDAVDDSTFDELLAAGPDLKTSSALVLLAYVWATTQLDCRLRAYEFMLSS